MSSATQGRFEEAIAECIESNRYVLATRWLGRLTDLIPVPVGEIFPADALLDHIPHLIQEVAKFIAVEDRNIASSTLVVAKARELGVLRHEQRASVHQLLREYELLRNILETFVGEQAEQLGLKPSLADVLGCVRSINQAVAILTQTTVDTFVERYTATIEEQTRRLERFNQMVSHELRQPLGALHAAAALLRKTEGDTDLDRHRRVVAAVERSVTRVVDLVGIITTMTTLHAPDDTKPGVQRVSLSTIAQEAARQLREMARSRNVEIVIAPDLPNVTVDVGRLELMLTNLFSNAIKYSDPSKPQRRVEVRLVPTEETACAFQVADNGLGMTKEQALQIFTPFFRAHAERDGELGVDGLGLGLSIVLECAEAIGASLQVDAAPGEGTAFTVRMPPEGCAGRS